MRLVCLLAALVLSACGGFTPVPEGQDAGVDAGVAAFSDGGLDLNDVSWLLPLPPVSQPTLLLGLEANGGRGELLPRALYDALPGLIAGDAPETLFASMRVVSVRLDPCFPATATGGCLKQLRLVVQPLSSVSVGTQDGTLHLFYVLSEPDFADARQTVWALKALAGRETDGKPLDVHPVMKREGLGGEYARTLHAMVKRLCGAQNLSRVAFMRLVQLDRAWRFGAFDVVNGALVADPIPRLTGSLTQQGVQEFGNTDFRSGELQPAASGDELPVLLSESELRLTDQRTYERAVTSALRLEHPGRSSPKTADCGSCHVVSRALTNARKERPIDVSTHGDRFVANPRFDLSRVDGARDGDDPRSLRAFGYFEDKSALSQRTINESAEVAEALSR